MPWRRSAGGAYSRLGGAVGYGKDREKLKKDGGEKRETCRWVQAIRETEGTRWHVNTATSDGDVAQRRIKPEWIRIEGDWQPVL